MLNNGNKKECGFADDIVAYIYDEIGSAERTKFESHLAGCMACTDEFAGISNARFAMFEWHKEEFAHLSTPEIVIPYAAKPKTTEAVGLFAGLRDLLTLPGWPSAVMVAGAVVICIGLGFFAINYVGNGAQVADNKQPVINDQSVPPVAVQNQQSVPNAPSMKSANESNLNGASLTASTKATPDREIRPVRASLNNQRFRYGRSLTASTRNVQPAIQQRKAPALTAFDDDDDKSLRLADLFDEGGS
jgi:hypothetical protein